MIRLPLALAAGLIASPAYTQDPQSSPVPLQMQDQQVQSDAHTKQFIAKVVIRDLYEIQSSHMALEKTRNHLVGEYAKRIIDDHTTSSTELKSLVQNVTGLQIPTQLDSRHKKMMEALRAASAQQFEPLYRTQQINAHEKAIKLFETYSKHGRNAELKQFAAKILPLAGDHQKMAKDLPPRGRFPVSQTDQRPAAKEGPQQQ